MLYEKVRNVNRIAEICQKYTSSCRSVKRIHLHLKFQLCSSQEFAFSVVKIDYCFSISLTTLLICICSDISKALCSSQLFTFPVVKIDYCFLISLTTLSICTRPDISKALCSSQEIAFSVVKIDYRFSVSLTTLLRVRSKGIYKVHARTHERTICRKLHMLVRARVCLRQFV